MFTGKSMYIRVNLQIHGGEAFYAFVTLPRLRTCQWLVFLWHMGHMGMQFSATTKVIFLGIMWLLLE